MVDRAHDDMLHALVARHDAAGKLIAAACHGPAARIHAKRASGEPFLKGRRATGLTNTEERPAGLKDVVHFLLEDAMKSSGADFHPAWVPMLSHIEHDGKPRTGQNPHSSEAPAKAMVEALSATTA